MKCNVGNQLAITLEVAALTRTQISEGVLMPPLHEMDERTMRAKAKQVFEESLERSMGHGMVCPTCRNS